MKRQRENSHQLCNNDDLYCDYLHICYSYQVAKPTLPKPRLFCLDSDCRLHLFHVFFSLLIPHSRLISNFDSLAIYFFSSSSNVQFLVAVEKTLKRVFICANKMNTKKNLLECMNAHIDRSCSRCVQVNHEEKKKLKLEQNEAVNLPLTICIFT